MTLFAFEVPLKHLEDFDEDQDYHFALSFLCRESKDYFKYIKDKVDTGQIVILDNSYNELNRPDDPREMVRLFRELGATAVVSPDSDDWDFEELGAAYKEMTSCISRSRVWVVVRTRTEYDFFRSLFSPHPVLCSGFDRRPHTPILNKCQHFLGLASLREIQEYRPISCDTSMPIKLALKGRTIEEWIREGCPHYHTRDWESFFDLHLTNKKIQLAKENICKIKALAKIAPWKDSPTSHGSS